VLLGNLLAPKLVSTLLRLAAGTEITTQRRTIRLLGHLDILIFLSPTILVVARIPIGRVARFFGFGHSDAGGISRCQVDEAAQSWTPTAD